MSIVAAGILLFLFSLFLLVKVIRQKQHTQRTAAATGPLRVLTSNPRYFTDSTGRAIYLTGSHTWMNLQDWADGTLVGGQIPLKFDYLAYLDFMTAHNHNFMRMWNWDSIHSDPVAWQRTGPGTAIDGKPKLDFIQYNQAYFDRLRTRVIQARDRGIYVSIMFFDGSWSQQHWDGHIFNPANNVQGLDGGESVTHTLSNPAVVAVQEAFVKKVIDTVNDLDNVLYEISNESYGSSNEWQYHMINLVKNYEAGKPRQHPVGMTITDTMATLFNSPADWISPGGDQWQDYRDNPPANDGRKVILTDSDHTGTKGANTVAMVWKNFTRGNQPILMDDPFNPEYAFSEPARKAAGHTLTYANKMNLAAMTPQGNLSSTGYALANPGAEYLVYQPGSGSCSVTLGSGYYAVEWFNPVIGQTSSGGTVNGGGAQTFTPSFSGAAVLYLKNTSITGISTSTATLTPTPIQPTFACIGFCPTNSPSPSPSTYLWSSRSKRTRNTR
jgi:hypothetical protein